MYICIYIYISVCVSVYAPRCGECGALNSRMGMEIWEISLIRLFEFNAAAALQLRIFWLSG